MTANWAFPPCPLPPPLLHIQKLAPRAPNGKEPAAGFQAGERTLSLLLGGIDPGPALVEEGAFYRPVVAEELGRHPAVANLFILAAPHTIRKERVREQKDLPGLGRDIVEELVLVRREQQLVLCRGHRGQGPLFGLPLLGAQVGREAGRKEPAIHPPFCLGRRKQAGRALLVDVNHHTDRISLDRREKDQGLHNCSPRWIIPDCLFFRTCTQQKQDHQQKQPPRRPSSQPARHRKNPSHRRLWIFYPSKG